MATIEPCYQTAQADLVCKVAANQHEREAAFRLIHTSYVRSGLIQPNVYGLHVTPYHLLPTTEVLLALTKRQVVCTASLIRDGALGLPMETIYEPEVEKLRREGVSFAEVSSLAERPNDSRQFFSTFLQLIRLLCPFARRHGVEQLLIAVHPRHARFYRRFLKFDLIGEERTYPRVSHQPAVAMRLDFASLECDHPDVHELLFGAAFSLSELQRQWMSPVERDYFWRIASLQRTLDSREDARGHGEAPAAEKSDQAARAA